jgi:hypothetical protein
LGVRIPPSAHLRDTSETPPSALEKGLIGIWRGVELSHRTTIEPITRQFGDPA